MSQSAVSESGVNVNSTLANRSPLRQALSRLAKDRTAKISGGLICIFVFLALAAPVFEKIIGVSPNEFNADLLDDARGAMPLGKFGGISADHWFGVEPRTGRDLFLRFVYGARTSMSIALAAALLATFIGVLVGLFSGYFGGKIDQVLSRLMEIILAFPSILFALAITPVLENVLESFGIPQGNPTRIPVMIFVIATFGWPYIARIVRGQVLSIKEKEYVEASRALGASTTHLVFKEILPNLWAPILVTVALNIPSFITTEAALTFLGAGVIEPLSDWGQMLLNSVPFYSVDPTYTAIPGIALFLLVLAFNFFADSARDALDPKSSR